MGLRKEEREYSVEITAAARPGHACKHGAKQFSGRVTIRELQIWQDLQPTFASAYNFHGHRRINTFRRTNIS